MPEEARSEVAEMGQQQASEGTGAVNWRAIGGVTGGGGALALIAAFFVSQFNDLKDEMKTVSHSVTAMDAKLSSMDSVRAKDQRELEIRIERLEEFRARVPDGTGLDRWTGKDMYIFSLELKDANRSIDLKVPDPREIHGR